MSTITSNVLPFSRRRVATVVVLVGLGIAAWFAAADRMTGMEMGGHFDAGSFGFFVVLWVLMMAAMMFPSVWPAVAIFGLVVRRRLPADASALGRSTVFVLGYLASWTAFGMVAFASLALARNVGLDGLSDADLSRYIVAPIALAAAAYQFVPFKQSCLRHCRGPLSFFLDHWRDGRAGALAMGSRHGAYCVGCCWMMMVVLLAVGVMSIAWMAFVSLSIAIEKLAPPRFARVASRSLTVGLVVLALIALFQPAWLPGIDGMQGMDEMGGVAGIR